MTSEVIVRKKLAAFIKYHVLNALHVFFFIYCLK